MAEVGETPAMLLATAVKVYAVPLASPPTTQLVAGAVTMQLAPPGAAVTEYEVAPATKETETVAWLVPPTTEIMEGVVGGAICGVTKFDVAELGVV